jgi:diguanylate cyclase (GGDEF)-like protein
MALRNLLQLAAILQLVLVCLSIPAWRASGHTSAARRGMVGLLFTFGGFFLTAMRGELPSILTMVGASAAHLIGMREVYGAGRELFEVRARPRSELPVVVVAIASIAVLWAVDGSPDKLALARPRVVCHALATIALLWLWLRDLRNAKVGQGAMGQRYLLAAGGAHLLMQILRIAGALAMKPAADPLASPAASWIVGAAMIISLVSTIGFILQIESRARETLLDANTRLSRDALTDALTGAPNRRHFETAAASELARARRYGWPVTLVLLDVDHFKRLNDRFGHQAGDVVLRELVQRCTRELRGHDLLARWGGEEFAVLLPQCDLDSASVVVGRLLAAVRDEPIEDLRGARVTMSAGLARLDPHDGGLSRALERADLALYESKSAGRNRFSLASALAAVPDPDLALATPPTR